MEQGVRRMSPEIMKNFVWPILVLVVGTLVVTLVLAVVPRLWRRYFGRPAATPGPPDCSDNGTRLLEAMREQIRGKRGYIVDAAVAARGLGMDFGSEEVDRYLHDLVRAGYLQEHPKRAVTAQGVYTITFAGIDAADAR